MNWADTDSDDDSDLGYGAAGVPPPASASAPSQVQTGYNSYGRPSMTMANNNGSTFQQQEQEQEESSDDSGSGSSSDDDDDDDDSDEEESTAKAAAAPPRGKTFRPPVGDGDSSSSSSDEEGGALKSTSNATAAAATSQINPNPGPPRGKELRLIQKPDSSSDDELMSTRRSSKGKGGKGKTNGGGTRKKPSRKPATTKESSSTTRKKATKRKAPNNDSDSDSDDDDDDDDDECIATIVGGSDSEGAMATVISSASNKKAKSLGFRKDGTPKRKPGPKKGWNKKAGEESTSGGNKKSSSSSNRGKKGGGGGASTATIVNMPEVSAEKSIAAQSARTNLQDVVPRLPHRVTDSHTVRSFGRIRPEYNVSNPLDSLYSSPHAIYPVGFSCDRFEFSPIHGRVIKMRCDILDGNVLKESREALKKEKVKASSSGKEEEKDAPPALVEESKSSVPGGDVENLGDGPVFRVTWGEGVEEDKLLEPSCPFDPYVASAHLGGDVDAIAVPLSSKKGGKPAGLPEVGMRVSVRFDKGKTHGGAITKVEPIEKKPKSRKKAICDITIQYDDGVKEVAGFPDPDIQVAYQGEYYLITSLDWLASVLCVYITGSSHCCHVFRLPTN